VKCCEGTPKESKAAIEKDARRQSALIWLGLCCVGFCLVGAPLLGVAFSAVGLAWAKHGSFTRTLIGLSLALFGTSLLLSFRHHRSWGPILVALAGGGAMVSHGADLSPQWAEWAGMAAFLAAWCWDYRLHRKAHERNESSGPASSAENTGSPDSAEEVTHGRH
jgi:hypothetical protein